MSPWAEIQCRAAAARRNGVPDASVRGVGRGSGGRCLRPRIRREIRRFLHLKGDGCPIHSRCECGARRPPRVDVDGGREVQPCAHRPTGSQSDEVPVPARASQQFPKPPAGLADWPRNGPVGSPPRDDLSERQAPSKAERAGFEAAGTRKASHREARFRQRLLTNRSRSARRRASRRRERVVP